ncbi:MAG: hypothetical protein AABP62_30440 [Planctomycetota bacterium]
MPCLFGVEPASTTDEIDAATRAQWRQVFDGVAAEYKLVRESENQDLALVDRATYTWARSGPHGGTYGAVYVWTNRGIAESVACFWRNPGTDGSLSIVHELHSLSPAVLKSEGKESDSWKPKAGLKRHPIRDAPVPAASAVGRMQQMRALCRDFSAHSVGSRGDRTELRLLPQPLYRYQSTDPDIVDGGLFAFVCSVGTDPEAFLQLEAINTADGPRWHYTAARFSHMNLYLNYKDKEVWQALRDRENTISHNTDHTYWVFHRPFDRMKLDASNSE